MSKPSNEAEAVAQAIVADDLALDLEHVQEFWDSYRCTELRWEAQKFIAMHDALTNFRAAQGADK